MFACTRKDRLMTRTGAPYLALELRDRTRHDRRPARSATPTCWPGASSAATWCGCAAGSSASATSCVLEVSDDRVAPSDEVDPAQFLPAAYRDLDELDGFLEHLAGRGLRPRLPRAARRAAGRRASCARRGAARPCTRAGHHAYLGGLLEHTVAVATLAHETCQLHPRLNSDLLLTAALVHDLGRTREFTYGAEIGLTEEGRLLGHLVIGAADARRARPRHARRGAAARAAALRALPPRPERPLPAGASRSAEALALYRLNALDAASRARSSTVSGPTERGGAKEAQRDFWNAALESVAQSSNQRSPHHGG